MTGLPDPGISEGEDIGSRLNVLLVQAGMPELDPELVERFRAYLSLVIRWNSRINLTAIRDREGILSRHFVESIACSHAVPAGVGTLLDFGSGAGFPGIPIALCRPEICVTLAESQGKKAAFLQEAVRTLGMAAKVYSRRAETIPSTFGCVTMRAVERMPAAVALAGRLISLDGWLIAMTTRAEFPSVERAAGNAFAWRSAAGFAIGEERVIMVGQRKAE
jgi:16S rRNA (guanine527-N7)-methyltransferase